MWGLRRQIEDLKAENARLATVQDDRTLRHLAMIAHLKAELDDVNRRLDARTREYRAASDQRSGAVIEANRFRSENDRLKQRVDLLAGIICDFVKCGEKAAEAMGLNDEEDDEC